MILNCMNIYIYIYIYVHTNMYISMYISMYINPQNNKTYKTLNNNTVNGHPSPLPSWGTKNKHLFTITGFSQVAV